MKRALLILVGIALLILIAAFAVSHFAKIPTYRGNELVPASTLLFVDLPDVSATRDRYAQTSLNKMLKEPTIASYLGKIRSSSSRLGEDQKVWFGVYQQFAALLGHADGELFLAISEVAFTPKVTVNAIMGCDDHLHQKNVKKAVTQLVEKLRVEFPVSQVEERNFESSTYQVWKNDTVQIAFGHLGNFFLVCYGEKSMQDAILRTKNPNETQLKSSAVYKPYVDKTASSDVIVFLNPEKVSTLVDLVQSFWKPSAGPKYKIPFTSFLMTIAFKGENIEDHTWMVIPPALRDSMGLNLTKKCERATLKIAGKDALFYGTIAGDLPAWISQMVQKLKSLESGKTVEDPFEQINNLLAYQKIDYRNDLIHQLGPEAGASVEWSTNAFFPSVNAAVQVQDPEKVKGCLDQLVQFSTTLYGITSEKIPGPGSTSMTSIHMKDSSGKFVSPSFAIVDKFLLLSLNTDSMIQMLKTYLGEGEALASVSDFKTVDAQLGGDYYQFVYLDQKRLFERGYNLASGLIGIVQPFIGQRHPGLKLGMDGFPPTREFTDHLGSSGSVAKATNEGFETVSVGPMSLPVVIIQAVLPELLESKKQ